MLVVSGVPRKRRGVELRKAFLVVLASCPFLTSGCIALGGIAVFGVLYAAADRGTKYRYDAPLDRMRTELDALCRDEQIEVTVVENEETIAVRAGHTADGRRVRIEAIPWDAESCIVFIHVGISGDTYAADVLHVKLTERCRPARR